MQNFSIRPGSALFFLVIVSFFLPWINFSCQGEQSAHVTGFQLITGTTIEQPSIGKWESRRIDPKPWAIVSFSLALFGFIISFSRLRRWLLASALAALIAVISNFLLLLYIEIEQTAGLGMMQVRYLYGFWIAAILLVAVLCLNLYDYVKQRRAKHAQPR